MSGVTTISANPAQTEYRLTAGHGCTHGRDSEQQFSYHADGGERPLRWIGRGAEAHGLAAGTRFVEGDVDRARALMRGASPVTGEVLVESKRAVYADAKVRIKPLLAAADAAAEATGTGVVRLQHKVHGRIYEQMRKTAASKGAHALVRADEAGKIADALGLDVDAVWGDGVYEAAFRNLTEVTTQVVEGTLRDVVSDRRMPVGNAGYDVTYTLPKSMSVFMAFAPAETAAAVEDTLYEQVERSFSWLEETTAYGMRGKHGGRNADGSPRVAKVVGGDGFTGWTMVHRAARPAGNAEVGDPHWHVHVTFANMTLGEDGKYSTVAAGGRDIIRHLPAVDGLYQAFVRHDLADRFGIQFDRNARNGEWEIVGVPDATIRLFSKRSSEVEDMLRQLGFDPETVTQAQHRIAGERSRQRKSDLTYAADATLQQLWRAEAIAAGHDPDAIAEEAVAGRTNPVQHLAGEDLITHLVGVVTDAQMGLTSTHRRFSRAEAIAAVADALPGGVASASELENLVDRVLASAEVVGLERASASPAPGAPVPAKGQHAAAHMANAELYTTAEVVAVEQEILAAARSTSRTAGVVNENALSMAISTIEAQQGYELSLEQRAALHAIATNGRRVQAVQGSPGTGKTTLMRALRVALETNGLVVAGAATAAVAAQNLQRESGVHSRTVASLLATLDAGGDPLAGVDVLIIDEANLTEDRSRAALYNAALVSGTRIVEIGDAMQLRGVGVGSLFGRVHQLSGGLQLQDNRRQRGEDERSAVAAWRHGRYDQALATWERKHRLTATETAIQARSAMVARWLQLREGAPDPHTEMRGLVMLASTNEQVDRINAAAQEVRRLGGELGQSGDYYVPDGTTVTVHVGDHVLLRTNDLLRRFSVGDPVLNGYRAVVTELMPDRGVVVEWEQPDGSGGYARERATLAAQYVERGGVDLGYAMTVHRAEGLTVGDQWTLPDGSQAAGNVLFAAAGADNPAMHVATSRHKDGVYLYAARDEVETEHDTWERGVPTDQAELTERVSAALAAAATRTLTSSNDKPVVADLRDLPEHGQEKVAWEARQAAQARTQDQQLEPDPHESASAVVPSTTPSERPLRILDEHALAWHRREVQSSYALAQESERTARTELENLRTSLERGEGPGAQARDEEATHRAAAAALDAQFESLRQEHDQLQQRAAALEHTTNQAERDLAAARRSRTRDEATTRLAAARDQHVTVQRQIAEAREQGVELQDQIGARHTKAPAVDAEGVDQAALQAARTRHTQTIGDLQHWRHRLEQVTTEEDYRLHREPETASSRTGVPEISVASPLGPSDRGPADDEPTTEPRERDDTAQVPPLDLVLPQRDVER